MVGYRRFMRNVKLNFLLIFFLIFSLSHQGCADCPTFVKSNTVLEGLLETTGWRTKISVIAIKDQGVDGYFNPKIKVCSYGGEAYPEYCHELDNKAFCKKIYGTQNTGAGVSALVFIDWEGNKTSINAKIVEGLKWEWADGVTDEEKKKFANSPKICACSQKGACISGISSWGTNFFSGENIFTDKGMENVCDTCYQTKIKCAPVPIAPGPPPFCEQLGMSPPQVRIVPITNNDNDYFNPKVKVIISDLKDDNGDVRRKLDFPKQYGENKAKKFSISDEWNTTHYFTTYKEKDKLCAEYYGTEREESKRKLQFSARCFPAPPAPEPEIVEIVQSGTQSNELKIKMKMSKETCAPLNNRAYSNGFCTFNVYANRSTNIGPLSLKVVRPAMVAETTGDNNITFINKSNFDKTVKGILKNDSKFKFLKKQGGAPSIEVECKEVKEGKCKLDSSGRPEIEVRYKADNSKSRTFCLSGWKPEPEEFVLGREDETISLKSMGVSYAQYNTIYSKESNQLYYFPCNKTVDLLAKPQSELDEMIFNKRGYVSIPEENRNRDNCNVKKTDEIDAKQDCSKCKIVYKLIDTEHKEQCKQDDDGCMCFNGVCERSTQYVTKDNKPFYLKISQEQSGVVKQLEQPIKANRVEVFYADKLCMFDLQSVKEKVLDTIKRRSESQNLPQLYEFSGDNNYTSDLSKYGYIEIEAWGGGEAGHIAGIAHSTESRPGIPGDYIKVQLKVDPEYPIIRAQATEGGGGLISHISNKDGGPTWIEMCNSRKQNCRPLITVTGGGMHKKYGNMEYRDTKIHNNLGNLKVLGNPTVVNGEKFIEDNKIAYIENGKIKREAVQCSNQSSNKRGAGGCINTSSRVYGKGSKGRVRIRSVKIDYEEIKKIINTLVINPSSNDVSDLIKELYPDIIKDIKEEIRKELLGK